MNKFFTYIELLNFQTYFIDFHKYDFEKKQAKMIFDEIGTLLEKKDFTNTTKHINESLVNVNFI